MKFVQNKYRQASTRLIFQMGTPSYIPTPTMEVSPKEVEEHDCPDERDKQELIVSNQWEIFNKEMPNFIDASAAIENQYLALTKALDVADKNGSSTDFCNYESILIVAYNQLYDMEEAYIKLKHVDYENISLQYNCSMEDNHLRFYTQAKVIIVEMEKLILEQCQDDEALQSLIVRYDESEESFERMTNNGQIAKADSYPALKVARSKIDRIDMITDVNSTWGEELLDAARHYIRYRLKGEKTNTAPGFIPGT